MFSFDHFGALLLCSVTFVLEVSEFDSLKVTSKDYFRVKIDKTFHFWCYRAKLKIDYQRDFNIFDQSQTLISCSAIHYLGISDDFHKNLPAEILL